MLLQINGVLNLIKDAEVKHTTDTQKLIEISVAANEQIQAQSGQWEDRPSFYTIKTWVHKDNKLVNFLKKGKSIAISGKVLQERWEKDGNKQSKIDVIVDSDCITLLDSSKSSKLPSIAGVVRLTADVEVFVKGTSTLLTLRVAASENVKRNNAWEEQSSFYTVKMWVPATSKIAQFLLKGKAIWIEGVLQQERWEKDGLKLSRHVVNCSNGVINLLGSKEGGSRSEDPADQLPNTPSAPADQPQIDLNDDEIPF